MPITLRKLDQTEAATAFNGNVLDLTEYVDALKQLGSGDAAEIPIPEGATRRATVQRFNKAAKQLGITLKWTFHVGTDGVRDGLYVRVAGSPGDVPPVEEDDRGTPERTFGNVSGLSKRRRAESAPESEPVAAIAG